MPVFKTLNVYAWIVFEKVINLEKVFRGGLMVWGELTRLAWELGAE